MEKEGIYILPARPRIVYMGTPDFAVPSLRALVEHGHNVLEVVTQPDRPKGRGRKVTSSPVKRMAVGYGLNVRQPDKASDQQFCEAMKEKAPDIIIVVAFGQILKKHFLEIPRWGVLNIHASLLPRHRGPAPIQWAILKNETITGLTAMKMDEGLDTGPILLKREVAIRADETAGELHDKLAEISGVFLLETLEAMMQNRVIMSPQGEGETSYAPKIDRGMSFIKWNQPAQTISAVIRALDPWPGAYTTLAGEKVKLFSSRALDEEGIDITPGTVAGYSQGALEVKTGKGVVQIRELQISGKKRLPAIDFLRGFPIDKGSVLG